MKRTKAIKKIYHWVGRIMLGVVLIALMLIVYGFVKEANIRKKIADEFPPPGKLVNIGTHSLHANCMGAGSPTVIFESDIDQLGSLSWETVQKRVSQFTRTISYDRAGIMWSEAGPCPRDGETIAKELKELLKALGEKGPFVLVGHAFGGAYIRIFSGKTPESVCGVVLVDSSHPEQLMRFEQAGLKKEIPQSNLRPLIYLLTHLGVGRNKKGPRYGMSGSVYITQQAFLQKSKLTWFDETTQGPNSLDQSGKYSFGGIPLTIIASARPPSSMSIKGKNHLQNTWLELQEDLTLLSDKSTLIHCSESGHYIHIDNPDVVVNAILTTIQKAN